MPDTEKLMIQIASWCSLRHGEFAELRRKDIQEHLETHAASGQEGPLFPSDVKRQMWPSTVTAHGKKAAAIAGRPDLRFHDLRHTRAAMAAQQAATRADLRAGVGHSTANAALLYPVHGQGERPADRGEPLETHR